MRIGIHQPMYLPWLGFFDRIYQCDTFILLDNIPYSKNYFINRNKIRTLEGWIWLTVPVLTKGNFGQLIKDVHIDNSTNWAGKHWKSLYYTYKKAPYFELHKDFFEKTYQEEWFLLIDLIEHMLSYLLNGIGIKTPVKKASLSPAEGKKEELVLNLCKHFGAKEYLSGPDGRNYLNQDLWDQNDIKILFHDYLHPEYNQVQGDFMPFMSVVDLLFNYGAESLKILTCQ